MLGFVVVTHGNLASELIATTEMIVGQMEGVMAVSIVPSCTQEDARQKIGEAVELVDKGKGVLILTDLFGGTPSNLSISFLEDKKVEIVTGVNLPMMMKLPNVRENLDIDDTAKLLQSYARENISIAGELLKGN
ncbi:MAG: PTS sugar transporter subunit IIA [bacterium]|nr:PTS sugar transporter subunit IIA [bacterium]